LTVAEHRSEIDALEIDVLGRATRSLKRINDSSSDGEAVHTRLTNRTTDIDNQTWRRCCSCEDR